MAITVSTLRQFTEAQGNSWRALASALEAASPEPDDLAATVAEFASAQGQMWLALAQEAERDLPVPERATTGQVEVLVVPGRRQRQVLEMPELATEEGMTAKEIAAATTFGYNNIYTLLNLLEQRGFLERRADIWPRRWRLASRFRSAHSVYARLASWLQAGEWTTSSDISVAMRGDTAAAAEIGRVAATSATFPHPERILLDGGRINPRWRHGPDGGIQRCRELLEQQGVRFAGGIADRTQRVLWDELRRRDAEHQDGGAGV
ncbi:hypothetical protein [Micromonospora sp. WMMD1082]|uniref:hypothetical protein n=1 Tax=Micromonospora sp. WMMD1082 TaxID=3016104 RepID=UPI002416A0B7|nr:hypothetical protein [Micromonospora sp. WMMD1082]MDG4795046.1 hypothetical protein [Micromonospora sp. WMMD1082]